MMDSVSSFDSPRLVLTGTKLEVNIKSWSKRANRLHIERSASRPLMTAASATFRAVSASRPPS